MKIKKILFTGFSPFGGEVTNPSWEAVKTLPSHIDGVEVLTAEMPTVFHKSIDALLKIIADFQPDAVICAGQAGGRVGITIERVAINCDDAPSFADNEGNQPVDKKIATDGPDAYFTTLPIKAMVRDLREAGVPAAVSNSAGTFVCNHIMYGLLHHNSMRQNPMAAGFVHIPFSPAQAAAKPNAPSMPLDLVVKGLETLVKTLLKNEDEVIL